MPTFCVFPSLLIILSNCLCSVQPKAAITKPDDNKGAQETGEREVNPSTASLYGVSANSTLLSSDGFPNGSFSGQSAIPLTSDPLSNFKNASDDGDCNRNSLACAAFSASVPNTESGITSDSSVSLVPTSSAPISAAVFGSEALRIPECLQMPMVL